MGTKYLMDSNIILRYLTVIRTMKFFNIILLFYAKVVFLQAKYIFPIKQNLGN